MRIFSLDARKTIQTRIRGRQINKQNYGWNWHVVKIILFNAYYDVNILEKCRLQRCCKYAMLCPVNEVIHGFVWFTHVFFRWLFGEKETNLHVRYFCSDWNQCFIMRRQHFNIWASVLISQDVIYIFNACDDSYVYRMHKYFPKTRALDTEMRTFGTQKNHPQLNGIGWSTATG